MLLLFVLGSRLSRTPPRPPGPRRAQRKYGPSTTGNGENYQTKYLRLPGHDTRRTATVWATLTPTIPEPLALGAEQIRKKLS